ncbi:hypothetical protein ACVIQT_006732 [Bradyrhizobium diazoefficiens]
MFGLEGQGNWADFSGDNISLLFPGSALVTGDRNRSRIDSFGLITGQVGYAWNSVLLYVKGGAAVSAISLTSTLLPALPVLAHC